MDKFKCFDMPENTNRKIKNSAKMANLVESLIMEKDINTVNAENKLKNTKNKFMEQTFLSNPYKSAERKSFVIKEDYIKKMSKLLFKEAVYEIYKNALVLDEEFVNTYEGNIRDVFEVVYDEVITESTTKYDISNKTNYLRDLISECERIAINEADKIVNNQKIDAGTDVKVLNEKIKKRKDKEENNVISPEAKSDFDSVVQSKTADVSEMIKGKVVDVIAHEREQAEAEDEFSAELEDLTTPTPVSSPTDGDGNPVEAETPIEEGTEIKPLKIIESSREIGSFFNMGKKLKEESLFSSIQTNITNKIIKSSKVMNEDINVDLDAVLAESITYYTLLETLYTLKLKSYTLQEKKDLCKSLVMQF